MTDFKARPLNESTWPDFARLVEKHNGVWGGCWCMAFHEEGVGRGKTAAQNRSEKENRVRAGRAHAALVYDGPNAVGWCQFGSTDELPRIKHKREYQNGLDQLPDWRITCFFVDREYRGQGVASLALEGALNEIARLGGGTVESYPEEVEGRSTSGSFLHNGTLSIFERLGFRRMRRLGKNHWVVSKVVQAQ
ncbi:MAG: GNAT family N-acetyltransferase [Chloroflexi bacterium]|nr:GNAT family N-acetyltransferase [Chloroflexota bacterium]